MVPFRPNLVVALFSRGKWPKTSKFQNSPKNGKRKQQMSNPPFWGVFHKVFRVFSFLRPIFCHLKKGHFRQKCPLLGTNLTPFFLHAPHTSAYLGHLPSLFGDTCQNICRSIVKKWNQAMKKVICDYWHDQKSIIFIWLSLKQHLGQSTTHIGNGTNSWKWWLWFQGWKEETEAN